LFERIGVVAGGQEFRSKEGSMVVRQWWHAEPTRAIRYRRLNEYADHYRSLLQLAVSDRMPEGSVLCELSGGLDSSSVTAAAVEAAAAGTTQVAALSILYPGYGGCDESAAISATRACLGLSNWHGVVDQPSHGSPWLNLTPRPESPYTFKIRLQEEAVALAVRLGCRVILTGFGGDEHTRGNPGFAATARLARGDFGIVRELQEVSRRSGISLGALARDRLARPAARRLLPQRLVREIEVHRVIRAYLPPWLYRNQPLLEQIREQYRRDSYLAGQDPYTRSIILKFRRSTTWAALDAYRWSARTHGIDVRAPFFDLRITRFLLSTPPDLWYRDDCGKYLVRQAFRGRLPESVLALEKIFYSEVAQSRWTLHRGALLAEIESARTRAVPGSQLDALLPQAGDNLDSVNRFSVLYAASLARWSNSRGNITRG
jgi:asparagine synthetase B (glutamine-hydrolysing)